MPKEVLTLYVLYFNPSDYPGQYVVRRQHVKDGRLAIDVEVLVFKTLTTARRHIPAGLVNIGRMPDDDPAILEAWV